MLLHLVRHGRPAIEPGTPASTWPLNESAAPELGRLRTFMAENVGAVSWHSSDEPKALATARALTDDDIQVEPALRETHRTDWFPGQEQFRAAALQAFATPDRPGHPGWEPLDQTRQRVSRAAATIVGRGGTDAVLVGHGTAWTLLVSELTGRPPDLAAWGRLRLPDLCTLDLGRTAVVRPWGNW